MHVWAAGPFPAQGQKLNQKQRGGGGAKGGPRVERSQMKKLSLHSLARGLVGPQLSSTLAEGVPR